MYEAAEPRLRRARQLSDELDDNEIRGFAESALSRLRTSRLAA